MVQPPIDLDKEFANMGAASAGYTRSVYLREGTCICRIDGAAFLPKTKHGKGFKLDMTVLANVSSPNGVPEHKPAEQVTWLVMEGTWKGGPESFQSRIKKPLCAILQETDPEKINAATMKDILAEPSALAGFCVETRTLAVPRKDQVAGAPTAMTMVTEFMRFVPGSEVAAILKDYPAKVMAVLYPNGIDAPETPQ